ncbi:MAG: anion permease [Methylocystaceae bacterium]
MFSLITLIVVIVLALAFDYVNGFHDTANAIATSISTKALSPRVAVILAAVLNFVGALSGTAVALTIGKGIVEPNAITPPVLISALIAAISWNLITWYFGIPSSSSHALIGGLTGGTLAALGMSGVKWGGFVKIVTSLIGSPLISFVIGSLIMSILFWACRGLYPVRINNIFRRLQILSASMMAFSHGTNDAQKSMGIITMALMGAGFLDSFHVPTWVILLCATAMALGTMSGGWRIIRTMGNKIFRIEPINGFAADLGSSLVIYTSSLLGFPVSTTHVVSGSIMGVGSVKRFRAVRWGIAQQMVTAWVVTIPCTALVAILVYQVVKLFF